MESRRTVWKIADLLVAAGLLGLVLASSMSKSEDSFAASAVSAPQAHGEAAAQTSDDAAASSAEAAFDGNAGSALPLADIPLAALFLVGICVLGAGLGPHARRSRRDTEQDAVLPESQVGRTGRAPN